MAVVVITGASSGIGEATAKLLAEEGHQLVLGARRVNRMEELAGQLGQTTDVLVVPTDVTNQADVEHLAQAAMERFGKIDVWINNAGTGGSSVKWLDEDAKSTQHVITVNLTAPILATRTVFPYMRSAGCGHIINVASVAGHVGTNSIYSATKFGLRGHSEALRRELRPFNIQVSVISPGMVRSEMTAHRQMRMPGPEIVAKQIAAVIRRPRREVIVPGWYRILIAVDRLFPWFTDRVLTPKEGKRKWMGERR